MPKGRGITLSWIITEIPDGGIERHLEIVHTYYLLIHNFFL